MALLIAAREFGSQSAASDSSAPSLPSLAVDYFTGVDVAEPVAPAPPRAPVVGLLDSAVNQVLDLLGVIDEKTKRFANAIATAEGFGVSGAIPTRAHNPGDLKLGDKGFGTLAGHTVFASDADGWAALYRQINLWRTGKSAHANLDTNIAQISEFYAGDSANWARNVAAALGVPVTTTLRQFFGDF